MRVNKPTFAYKLALEPWLIIIETQNNKKLNKDKLKQATNKR